MVPKTHTSPSVTPYECGSYYMRALASYALLGAMSGFRYSAVEKCLWFAPRSSERPFKCFFSTATGWGAITLDAKRLTIAVEEGELALERFVLGRGKGQVVIERSARVGKGSPLAVAVAEAKCSRRRGRS